MSYSPSAAASLEKKGNVGAPDPSELMASDEHPFDLRCPTLYNRVWQLTQNMIW